MPNVKFFEITSLVPSHWRTWFYAAISEDAPFSWGDNNRTLVTAERLHDHCADVLDIVMEDDPDVDAVDVDNFLRNLEKLGQTYIDLEN
jgi:hypothetical protein